LNIYFIPIAAFSLFSQFRLYLCLGSDALCKCFNCRD